MTSDEPNVASEAFTWITCSQKAILLGRDANWRPDLVVAIAIRPDDLTLASDLPRGWIKSQCRFWNWRSWCWASSRCVRGWFGGFRCRGNLGGSWRRLGLFDHSLFARATAVRDRRGVATTIAASIRFPRVWIEAVVN